MGDLFVFLYPPPYNSGMRPTTTTDVFGAPRSLWVGMFVYFLIFGGICLWKFFNFGYNALDLAIVTNALEQTLAGNLLGSTIHPPSYLGDHFTPLLLLLAPIYALVRSPLTLLFVQTVALGFSAYPVYQIALRWRPASLSLGGPDAPRLASLAESRRAGWIAGAWLLNPFLHNLNLFEFEPLALAVPLGLFAALAYVRGQRRNFLLFLLSICLVREDAALLPIGFGLLALWQHRGKAWWLPALVGGAVWLGVALGIIQQFSAGGYKFFIYYGWLQHWQWLPVQALAQLLRPNNWIMSLGLLLPFGFLPLGGWPYLVVSLPAWLQIVLQQQGGSTAHLLTHYTALLLPGLVLASVAVLTSKKLPKWKMAQRYLADRSFRWLLAGVIVGYTTLTLGPLGSAMGRLAQTGPIDETTYAKLQLLQRIPRSAAVAGSYQSLALLASRQKLYAFNYAFLGSQQFLVSDYALPADTEFIALDYDDLLSLQAQYAFNPFYAPRYQERIGQWHSLLDGFGLVGLTDTLALYQRGALGSTQLLTTLREPLPLQHPIGQTREALELLGFNQQGATTQLLWRVTLPIDQPVRFVLTARQGEQLALQKMYPFAYDLLPASGWLAGELMATLYDFRLTEKLPVGNYQLELQLLTVTRAGLDVDGLRSTRPTVDQTRLWGEPITLGEISVP